MIFDTLLEKSKPYPFPHAMMKITVSFWSNLLGVFFFWIPRSNPPTQSTMKQKPPTKNIMTQLIRSEHTDPRGIAFAGQILAWMDICSGIAARKHAGVQCVTVAVDAVHFLNPVRINQICILRASVNRSWGTSMEVGVSVESEDMITGTTQFCCHGYFTFVTVGKLPVPVVSPTSMRGKRRYHEAQERRSNRLSTPKQTPIPCILNDSFIDGGQEPESYHRRNGSFSEIIVCKKRNSIPSAESYTLVTEIVFPEHCNSMQITFGGQIMKWMVDAASIAANRHIRNEMLVASIDSLSFLHPSKQVFYIH
jgi:acyl-CoA hydrolase